jgi:hypothetical protein
MLIALQMFTPLPAGRATGCAISCAVSCAVSCAQTSLQVTYSLDMSLAEARAKLAWPAPLAMPGRTTGLWQHTCFELFLRQPGSRAYIEVNAAPTGAWNCFSFSDYREDMQETTTPRVTAVVPGSNPRAPAELQLVLDLQDWLAGIPPRSGATTDSEPAALQLGLSAVIADQHGGLGYFALGHATARPDFHHHLNHSLTIPWSHS